MHIIIQYFTNFNFLTLPGWNWVYSTYWWLKHICILFCMKSCVWFEEHILDTPVLKHDVPPIDLSHIKTPISLRFLCELIIIKNKTNYPISSNSHPSATSNKVQPQNKMLQNQREHHIILTYYEAVHPTAVPDNNSSSGMLMIETINRTVWINIYLKGQ